VIQRRLDGGAGCGAALSSSAGFACHLPEELSIFYDPSPPASTRGGHRVPSEAPLQGGRDVPHLVPEEHEQVVERKDPHYLALPIDDRAAAASPPHLSRRRPTSTYRELLDGLCREHHV
jgi:hypothetical protein